MDSAVSSTDQVKYLSRGVATGIHAGQQEVLFFILVFTNPLTASLSQPKPKIRMWEVFDSGRALCSCLSPVIHDLAELTAQLLTIVCALTHPNMNRRGQLINDYTTCLMYCSARRAQ